MAEISHNVVTTKEKRQVDIVGNLRNSRKSNVTKNLLAMNDLFGNEVKPPKVYKRDSIGRFADEKTAEYERALMEASKYKQMYLAAQSRMRGIANILRMKDELIYKLRQ